MDWKTFAFFFLANCLVSAAVGWWAAGQKYGMLAFKVASMEAAVAAYWDRIRKRMRVEPLEVAAIENTNNRQPGLIPLPPEKGIFASTRSR